MKDTFFKGSLGDVTGQRSAWVHKKICKKVSRVDFSIFIENRNWDFKFVFRFDNEKEKRKKKLCFILKQNLNVPFKPRIVYGKYNSKN